LKKVRTQANKPTAKTLAIVRIQPSRPNPSKIQSESRS
jgi:hypothetical protein